ncbi:MAG: hypothetical protein KAH21_13425, partial [Spirochaetaceae bacterium]|nr:hypothetical protein [Spirochaetaceae bacterium]
MSRKTIPLLMVSIAVLLFALVIIIVVMLSSLEVRVARESRKNAFQTLLSRSPGELDAVDLNLNLITLSLRKPFSSDGSLDNLVHFLSKDPGRREFAGAGDRRRAANYLDGETAVRAERYIAELNISQSPEGLPEWTPEYIGKVRALFDNVRDDLLIISGIPGSLTDFSRPDQDEDSITMKTEAAVA